PFELALCAHAIRPLHVFARHAREFLRVRGALTGPVGRTVKQHHETRHGRLLVGLRRPASRQPPVPMSIQATPDRHRLLSLHSCGAHAVHHPAAFTCLPGNSWHGPWAKVSISSPVPPRETCATTAVRRCSLVIAPRLMAKDSTTCCPLRSPRFVVSMKTPVALRLTALQSLRRPPGAVM